MRMGSQVIFFVCMVAICMIIMPVTIVGESNAAEYENRDGNFSIDILDGNKKKIETIIDDAAIYYDTETCASKTIFRMKSTCTIDTIPSYIYISSNSGLFNVEVSTDGLNSYLKESGLEMTLKSETETFVNHIDPLTNTPDFFMFNDDKAELSPNTMYRISISTWREATPSEIVPEDMDNVTITFTASIAKGFHQVTFFNDGEALLSYKVRDGEAITQFPTNLTHANGTFKGWFTPEGVQIYDGYIVTPEDQDIIANATWEESNNTLLYIILGLIVTGIAASAFIVFMKKKKGNDQV